MINTIVTPVGIRKVQRKSKNLLSWEWVDRWVIVDSAGLDVAILDSEFPAIEITLLLNNDKTPDYVCNIDKNYDYLYKIADNIEKNKGKLSFNI